MNKIANQFTSIEQVADRYLNTSKTSQNRSPADISFAEILQEKQSAQKASELKFSKHAAMRLEHRNISLSPEQNERLEAGVQKASEKGINESLVVVDSLAFIVNIPNKTVVTAIDSQESQENIFTNIDGAVIV